MPGLITTRLPSTRPAPSAPRMRGLGTDGQPFADPQVEVVERGGTQLDEHFAGPGLRIGRVLVAEYLGPAVLVDANRLHEPDLSM